MPLIQIVQAPGKSADQKREITREVTDAFVRATGSKPESVWITISEVATDSWSIAGETLSDRAAKA
jgi:4-oxalocrotonate tautomerase